jgi:hypothetical protein
MSVEAGQIPITSPCPITLDRGGVTPEDRSMFCDHCVKDVHLVSKMTEHEARAFMQDHAGEDICVSYVIRSDGRIRFRPEPELVPVHALVRQPQRLAMVASVGAAALLAACTAHSDPERIHVDAAPTEQRVEQVEPTIPSMPSEPPPGVEPCDPLDVGDLQVGGGLRAQPIPQPKLNPPRQPVRGRIRAHSLDDNL